MSDDTDTDTEVMPAAEPPKDAGRAHGLVSRDKLIGGGLGVAIALFGVGIGIAASSGEDDSENVAVQRSADGRADERKRFEFRGGHGYGDFRGGPGMPGGPPGFRGGPPGFRGGPPGFRGGPGMPGGPGFRGERLGIDPDAREVLREIREKIRAQGAKIAGDVIDEAVEDKQLTVEQAERLKQLFERRFGG